MYTMHIIAIREHIAYYQLKILDLYEYIVL